MGLPDSSTSEATRPGGIGRLVRSPSDLGIKTLRDAEAIERERLERELFERAHELKRLAILHRRYVASTARAEAATRYRMAEENLFAVVTLIESLDSQVK